MVRFVKRPLATLTPEIVERFRDRSAPPTLTSVGVRTAVKYGVLQT
jgi:hypothetical protein